MSDSCRSGTMRAWVIVLAEPNEDGELVELIEMEAGRIPKDRSHRPEYAWFMDDHWDGSGSCFWDEADWPIPGEYVVSFHIEGEWTYSSNGNDYDEQLIVEKVEAVDLGAYSSEWSQEARDVFDDCARSMEAATTHHVGEVTWRVRREGVERDVPNAELRVGDQLRLMVGGNETWLAVAEIRDGELIVEGDLALGLPAPRFSMPELRDVGLARRRKP